MLCSSRPLGEGLPGFQRLPSAATSLCPARGHPPGGVRSPLPPRVPACGEPALLLPPPCEPAMRGGSQSAVKVASLLGRGEGGRHQLPVTLGKSLPLFCPQPPCLQDGETRAVRSGGAAWGVRFPAGFCQEMSGSVPMVCGDGAPCSWWVGAPVAVVLVLICSSIPLLFASGALPGSAARTGGLWALLH